MSLATKITKGRVALPKRLMVHGAPGVGKSSFAAGAPDVLFIDPERRTGHLDVARTEPETWMDVLQTVAEVIKERAAKVLVFSTVDYIESMVWRHLCKTTGASSIEEVGGGWGKGYTLAADEFRRLSNAMEDCRKNGITVVLEAHSVLKEFRNPSGDNYDVWQIKLHKSVKALLTERCDAVGFATFEDLARKKVGETKAKAVTTGERVLMFKHHPAFETKRGFELPDEMPLTWAAWSAAVSKANGDSNSGGV